MIGLFIIDENNKIYLRTKPDQTIGFRCINEQLFAGQNIDDIIHRSVKSSTNLNIFNYDLLSVSQGSNLIKNGEQCDMLFVDYLVKVLDSKDFNGELNRKHVWQGVDEWLELEDAEFGLYIKNIIYTIKQKLGI